MKLFNLLLLTITLGSNILQGQTPWQNPSIHWENNYRYIDFSTGQDIRIGINPAYHWWKPELSWGPMFRSACCPGQPNHSSSCSKDFKHIDMLEIDGVLKTKVEHGNFLFYPVYYQNYHEPDNNGNCITTSNPINTPIQNSVPKNYRSSALTFWEKAHFGFYSIKVKIVDVDGLQGSFWMIGGGGSSENNDKFYEEIDILESWTDNNNEYGPGRPYGNAGVHWWDPNIDDRDSDGKQNLLPNNGATTDFVRVSIEWAPNYIIFYHDDKPVHYFSEKENPDLIRIPKHEMWQIIALNLQQNEAINNANLPLEWEWDDYKRYRYSNIQTSHHLSVSSLSSLFTAIDEIPASLTINGISQTILTSYEVQIRATDEVTIQSNVTIDAQGGGNFTILTPDFDQYMPLWYDPSEVVEGPGEGLGEG